MPNLQKIIAGGYTAIQNPHGDWSILNVPIFGETSPGEKGVPIPINRRWHYLAVQNHLRSQAEGYYPPTQLYHTNDDDPEDRREPAGQFIIRRLGSIKYRGHQMSVIYADLRNVPNHIFQKIERGLLPYLSVEVKDYRVPRFSRLALLDSEPPHFKFRNLEITKKIHYRGAMNHNKSKAFLEKNERGLCSMLKFMEIPTMAEEAVILKTELKFQDNPWAICTKTVGRGDEDKYERCVQQVKQTTGQTKMNEQQEKDLDLNPEKDAKMQEEEQGNGLEERLARLEQLVEKWLAQEQAEPVHNGDLGIDQMMLQEDRISEKLEKLSVQFGEVLGKVSVLERAAKDRAAAEKLEKMLQFAETELVEYNLDDAMRKNLKVAAESGEKAFKACVDTIKRTAPKNLTFNDEPVLDAQAAKFAEEQAADQDLKGAYDHLKGRGMINYSFDEFKKYNKTR